MLVPLELKTIADRYGFLSPDIAIGYRAAAHARDYFGGVEELRGMAFCNDGGCFPVRRLLEGGRDTGRVIHQDIGQYRFVFIHKPTLTVLNALAHMRVLTLPPCGQCIEDRVRTGGGEDTLGIYAGLIEDMVGRIVTASADELFALSTYRCRPAFAGANGLLRFLKCQRCKNAVRQDRLYDVEGFILCPVCAGVAPSWFNDEEAVPCEHPLASGSIRRPIDVPGRADQDSSCSDAGDFER